jgi:hypothetical protein
VRRGYGGKASDGPVSVWVHFDRCTSTVTPACQLRISPNVGRVSRGRERGGGVTSPLLFLLIVRGFRFGRGILPRALATIRALTQACLFYFRACSFSLWAWFASCLTAS